MCLNSGGASTIKRSYAIFWLDGMSDNSSCFFPAIPEAITSFSQRWMKSALPVKKSFKGPNLFFPLLSVKDTDLISPPLPFQDSKLNSYLHHVDDNILSAKQMLRTPEVKNSPEANDTTWTDDILSTRLKVTSTISRLTPESTPGTSNSLLLRFDTFNSPVVCCLPGRIAAPTTFSRSSRLDVTKNYMTIASTLSI